MDTDAIPTINWAENLAAPNASLSIVPLPVVGGLRFAIQPGRPVGLETLRVVWNFVRTAGVWAESGSGISIFAATQV